MNNKKYLPFSTEMIIKADYAVQLFKKVLKLRTKRYNLILIKQIYKTLKYAIILYTNNLYFLDFQIFFLSVVVYFTY